jgi:hypothetical protein
MTFPGKVNEGHSIRLIATCIAVFLGTKESASCRIEKANHACMRPAICKKKAAFSRAVTRSREGKKAHLAELGGGDFLPTFRQD